MDASATVRALRPEDVESLVRLRREALEDTPVAFAASVEDDRGLDVAHVHESLGRSDGFAVFGAFLGGRLVGMVGLVREGMLKMRHKAVVWGMFVSSEARGRGVAAALLRAAVDRARSWDGVRVVGLSASEATPNARRLYERAGFRSWGAEPLALAWEGRLYVEHHYVLDLDASSS